MSDAVMKALSPNSRMGKIMQSQVLKMSVEKFDEVLYQCICIKQGRERAKPKIRLNPIIQKALNVMAPEQCDEMGYQINILKKAKLEAEKKAKLSV